MATFTIGDGSRPSSRLLSDLHPEMQVRCNALFAAYAAKYPDNPQPFLTQTYRNKADQNADYAKGRTAPGLRVTNAVFGRSPHNAYPALAFDVAFKDANGTVDWKALDFSEMGALAASVDLEWGISFGDRPHFQPHNAGAEYRWEAMAHGSEPTFTPLPA
jgi:peptidoglycan LD-endopeptidase CwlK